MQQPQSLPDLFHRRTRPSARDRSSPGPDAPAHLERAHTSVGPAPGQHAGEAARAAAETARAVVAAVSGAECASILRVCGQGRILAGVGTDRRADALDARQTGSACGPGLEALHLQQPVLIDDVATETRWPEFTVVAVALGIGGVLCLPLATAGQRVGVLSVYAGGRHALTSDEHTLAGVFARRAAITLQAPTRRAEQSRARAGRDVPLTNSGGEGIGSSGSTVDNDHATVAVAASELS